MINIITSSVTPVETPVSSRFNIAEWLATLKRLAANSTNLIGSTLGHFERNGRRYEIPRYVFVGPQRGDVPIPIGIFAGIYGNEVEGVRALARFVQLLEAHPELAAGYCLFFYPACNPSGLEAGTALTANRKDLNLELLRSSDEPEARLLQAELAAQKLEGIIRLHTDADSHAFHGLVRGETLTKQFLNPALVAAAQLLRADERSHIADFRARDVSYDHYEGSSLDPVQQPVRPFEVILKTPGQSPAYLREWALVVALRSLLLEYRQFIAHARNL